MDLAIGAKDVYVMMTLFTRTSEPKLVPQCTDPLTGLGLAVGDVQAGGGLLAGQQPPRVHLFGELYVHVSRVYTDHAVFDVGPGGIRIRETYGVSAHELAERLGITQR